MPARLSNGACRFCYNNIMENSLLAFDRQIISETNAVHLIGIDEAGRGPLAGPVVACACYLPPEIAEQFAEVNDSKKLSPKKRDALFERLTSADIRYGVGFASAAEIDQLNILQATFLAMRRAAQKLTALENAFALIDGPHKCAGLTLRQLPVVDGDAKSLCVAAASIIAKVTRDRYMDTLEKLYPHYGFAAHKGYGTAVHMRALKTYGPCAEHRKTFAPVRKLLPAPPQGGLFD